jgi:hypothetical protein
MQGHGVPPVAATLIALAGAHKPLWSGSDGGTTVIGKGGETRVMKWRIGDVTITKVVELRFCRSPGCARISLMTTAAWP